MIKIDVNKIDNLISGITIVGHSNYSESGTDIVCSAVSSIAITTVNAILKINEDSIDYEEKDGYLKIDILVHTDVIDTLIDNMIELLEELQEQYKKFIKINR